MLRWIVVAVVLSLSACAAPPSGQPLAPRLVLDPGGHVGAVTALAVAADGKTFASAGEDGTVRLWAMADGKPAGVLRPPLGATPAALDGLAFDGETLLAAAGSRVFAFRQGKLAGRRDGAPLPARTSVILDDGRRLQAAPGPRIDLTTADGVTAWTIAAPAAVADGPALQLQLSPDGSAMRLGDGRDRAAFSFTSLSPQVPDALFATALPPAEPPARRVLPDRRVLSGDGRALRLDSATGHPLWRSPTGGIVRAVAAAPEAGLAAAALSDGTVRWYSLTNGAEHVAVYIRRGGDRWLAWMPDGIFDHSDAAWNIAAWHIERSPDQAAEVVTVGQLYELSYRPDLLRRAFLGESLGLDERIRARRTVAAGLPPAVELSSSAGPDGGSAEVVVKARDRGLGVARAAIRVNGITVALEDLPAAARSGAVAELRRTVRLRGGQNQIEAVAYSADGAVESSPVRTSIGSGATEPAARPRLHVLVVGIDAYAAPDLRLAFAGADARAFATALRRSAQPVFHSVNTRVLRDRQAHREDIIAALRDMAAAARPDDVFLLYLAGHGVNLDGRYHFLTAGLDGTTEDAIVRHGIDQETLGQLLAAVPAGQAVVVLDTCYAGAFKADDPDLLIRTGNRKLARLTGRAFLTAANDQQEAAEGYHGHGIFTYALLEALGGQAGGDTVTVGFLGDHARSRVPLLASQAFNHRQTPVFTLTGRDFAIGKAGR